MPSIDDDMSIREIGRTLADFRLEVRSQFAQLVRNDVYRAEQTALDARLSALEKANERDSQDRTESRRLVYGALVTAVASVIVSLVLAAFHH